MEDKDFAFGNIVKRERSRQNLTLKELSERTGERITPSYINRLEVGNKSKPSFDVVAELCVVLNLDIREVFQSFGYESLIKNYDQNAEFTVEEIFRLHKIKIPGEYSKRNDLLNGERLLNMKEQEQLILLIHAIFDYSFAEETNTIEMLNLVIKQMHELRKMEQKELARSESFDIQKMGVTYTLQFDREILSGISDFNQWKDAFINAIDKYEEYLAEHQSGIITFRVGEEKWIIQKAGSHLKLLFMEDDIVSLG